MYCTACFSCDRRPCGLTRATLSDRGKKSCYQCTFCVFAWNSDSCDNPMMLYPFVLMCGNSIPLNMQQCGGTESTRLCTAEGNNRAAITLGRFNSTSDCFQITMWFTVNINIVMTLVAYWLAITCVCICIQQESRNGSSSSPSRCTGSCDWESKGSVINNAITSPAQCAASVRDTHYHAAAAEAFPHAAGDDKSF